MDGFALIDIAVETKSRAEGVKLAAALATLAGDEPRLVIKTDEESGQTIISSVSEEHLDAVLTRVRGEFGVAVNVGAPQVAYREAITRAAEHDYTHSGPGAFARIKFRIEPASVNQFVAAIAGASLSASYVAAVRRGVETVFAAGPIIGFPMVDVKFVLLDGAWHGADSSDDAFETAAHRGFTEAIEKASPVVLEPIMQLKVRSPFACIGDVIGDINSRRGRVEHAGEGEGALTRVEALVPLANMFGYRNSLRAMSAGAASFELAFDHYERTPDPLGDPDDRFRPAMAMRA